MTADNEPDSQAKRISGERRKTSGRTVFSAVIWNLFGFGVPLLVALVAIPFLIGGLGIQRYGVLVLVWSIIGYFSIFDFGLGRAVTKLVAERLGSELEPEVPQISVTALVALLVFGAIGGVSATVLSPWAVVSLLQISGELRGEAIAAFRLVGITVPIVTTTIGLIGILHAYQRFDIANIIRIPLGIFSFLGPVLVLPFSTDLKHVVGVLLLGRLVGLTAYGFGCLKVLPDLHKDARPRWKSARALLSLGGWITVSNIVSPIMTYLDRFLVGTILSVSAVTYYSTPYDMVSRLNIVANSVATALFPVFASEIHDAPKKVGKLLIRAARFMIVLLFLPCLFVVVLGYQLLELWIGPEFADHAAPVLRWLAIGVFINVPTYLPLGLLQASGRADMAAKLHLLELPIYLGAVLWLTTSLGIMGTAIAWTGRVVVDSIFMFLFSSYRVPDVRGAILRTWIFILACSVSLGIGAELPDHAPKLLYVVAVTVVFAPLAWRFAITADERVLLWSFLRRSGRPVQD